MQQKNIHKPVTITFVMAAIVPKGNLMKVCVELESNENSEKTKEVCVYVWAPNKILPQDQTLPFFKNGGTYIDCMEESSWDDWCRPFQWFFDYSEWNFTGCFESAGDWEDVPFDDERIHIAYTDPLNKDKRKRCTIRKT
jgi:hypothetical protein